MKDYTKIEVCKKSSSNGIGIYVLSSSMLCTFTL